MFVVRALLPSCGYKLGPLRPLVVSVTGCSLVVPSVYFLVSHLMSDAIAMPGCMNTQ